MWTVLNADALREAALVTEPFPHLIVGNIIRPEALPEVVASFPRIGKRGSFPPEAVSCSGRFATLIEEMHSVELRDLVGERLGTDLSLSKASGAPSSSTTSLPKKLARGT